MPLTVVIIGLYLIVQSLRNYKTGIDMQNKLLAYPEDMSCPKSPILRPLRPFFVMQNTHDQKSILQNGLSIHAIDKSNSRSKLSKKRRVMSFLNRKKSHK